MPRPALPPEFVSISEAAALLGVTRQAIYTAIDTDRVTVHEYEGRKCLLRDGLREQWLRNTRPAHNSPITAPNDDGGDSDTNLGRLIRRLIDRRPSDFEWPSQVAAYCNEQGVLDPDEWPGTPWPAWRWATVMTAISLAAEALQGDAVEA